MILVHLIPLHIATPARRVCSKARKVKGKTPINTMSFGSLWSKLLSSAQPKELRGAMGSSRGKGASSSQISSTQAPAQCSHLPMRSWDWRTCEAIASFFQLTPARPSNFMGHTCCDVNGSNLGNWLHATQGHSTILYPPTGQNYSIAPTRCPFTPAKEVAGFSLLAHSLWWITLHDPNSLVNV